MILFIRNLFFLFIACSFSVFSATPTVLDNPQVLRFANSKLPHEGTLKQTSSGFLYVELPKEYVFELIPLMSKGSACPPPYFEKDKIGAHISVAYSKEIKNVKPAKIPYLGEKVSFSIGNLKKVELQNSNLGSEVYFLTIESPQITEIRKSLGLSPTIKGNALHITIAVNCPK